MNNQQVTIVGVTPLGFKGIQRLGVQGHEVTVPISLERGVQRRPDADHAANELVGPDARAG